MTDATNPADETREDRDRLIATNRIEGTAVYNPAGERLGEIHHLMVGRRSGQVAYAVMSFGGFFGLGENLHPLPWDALAYDTSRGGYVVDIDRSLLEEAPSHRPEEDAFSDPDYGRRLQDYWPTRPAV